MDSTEQPVRLNILVTETCIWRLLHDRTTFLPRMHIFLNVWHEMVLVYKKLCQHQQLHSSMYCVTLINLLLDVAPKHGGAYSSV